MVYMDSSIYRSHVGLIFYLLLCWNKSKFHYCQVVSYLPYFYSSFLPWRQTQSSCFLYTVKSFTWWICNGLAFHVAISPSVRRTTKCQETGQSYTYFPGSKICWIKQDSVLSTYTQDCAVSGQGCHGDGIAMSVLDCFRFRIWGLSGFRLYLRVQVIDCSFTQKTSLIWKTRCQERGSNLYFFMTW